MNTEHTNQSTTAEPFGYFKAEPFGWTDCEKGDEGAIALYERPQAQPVARDVLMAAMRAAVAECAEICDVYSIYDGARCASEIRHQIMSDKLVAIADRYAAQPLATAEDSSVVQAGVAVPVGYKLVPVDFIQGFHALAHNYSLQAQAPDYYAGRERDAFSAAYARCGSDLAKLRAMLAAAPQAAVSDGCPNNYKKLSEWLEHENAVLRQKAVAVPDGYALVPVVANDRMRAAGRIGIQRGIKFEAELTPSECGLVWAYMVGAAAQKGGA
ncbi:hypothetical protein [Vogesella sp. XCS3]|uniref:hypothetical protein n=1 Tax=Vogesella sp. XCS3 TaxID=2877939 RepID=UPI001D0B9871|nr:hypothetical protein [Vogesella sp. XCS3]UDM17878.1 hypothetical protein LCH97_04225 [Vogesella sp. XCS3]